MALTLQQKMLLREIKKNRPDLIQRLRAEHYEEWSALKADMVEATKRRAKILAGTKSALNQNSKKKHGIEAALSAKTKILAGL